MKYYKLNRGGEGRLKYPEPELFGEWEEGGLLKMKDHLNFQKCQKVK